MDSKERGGHLIWALCNQLMRGFQLLPEINSPVVVVRAPKKKGHQDTREPLFFFVKKKREEWTPIKGPSSSSSSSLVGHLINLSPKRREREERGKKKVAHSISPSTKIGVANRLDYWRGGQAKRVRLCVGIRQLPTNPPTPNDPHFSLCGSVLRNQSKGRERERRGGEINRMILWPSVNELCVCVCVWKGPTGLFCYFPIVAELNPTLDRSYKFP